MDTKQVKRALVDIIIHAYPGSSNEEIKKYSDFVLRLLPDELASKCGDYNPATQTLRIFGVTPEKTNQLVATALHELAHHMDYLRSGTTDHQRPFYEEYRKLIYSALDLGYIAVANLINGTRGGSDGKKVRLIIADYIEDRGRIIDECKLPKTPGRIEVYNGYSIKEDLKQRGFRWDPDAKAWFKEDDTDIEEDAAYLDDLSKTMTLNYSVKREGGFLKDPELPESYCMHEFTGEEKEALLSGKEIYIDKAWSRKNAYFFSCYLSWDGMELKPRFGD